MVRFLSGFTVISSICLATSVAWAGERARLTIRERPPVGSLSCKQDGRTYRTRATLIGDRTTLLAVGHFMGPDRAGPPPPIDCHFILTLPNGRQYRSSVGMIESGGGAFERRLSSAADWALLSLNEAAPAEIEPIRGAAKLSDEARPVKLGTSSDKSCRAWVDPQRKGIIQHDCPTKPGSSGAPLLISSEGEWLIAGVHVARAPRNGEAANVNNSILDIFERALARLS